MSLATVAFIRTLISVGFELHEYSELNLVGIRLFVCLYVCTHRRRMGIFLDTDISLPVCNG